MENPALDQASCVEMLQFACRRRCVIRKIVKKERANEFGTLGILGH